MSHPTDAKAMPADPVTDLAAGAAQLHEVFCAYIDAGFTGAQALQLCCTILSATIHANHGAGGSESL